MKTPKRTHKQLVKLALRKPGVRKAYNDLEKEFKLLNPIPTSKIKKHRGIISDLWMLLDNRPWQGKRSKRDIQEQIKKERKAWDKKR